MGVTYYVFPGGGVEDGETPEHAASREAREELCVDVDLGSLILVTHREAASNDTTCRPSPGERSGRGTEMTTSGKTVKGTYVPVWLPLNALTEVDVRPREISDKLAS